MDVDEDFTQWAGSRQRGLVRAAYLVCGEVGLAEDRSAAVPDTGGAPFEDGLLDRVGLEDLLGGLTPGQRAVVVLRYFEDRPIHQCAEILGVREGTIKSQTHDALVRLRVEVTRHAWREQS